MASFPRCVHPAQPVSLTFGMPAKSNIFAFFGSDEALVKEAALRCARDLAPPDDEFGLEVVSGAADNSDHASRIVASTIEAIQTLPFFGGGKVVWLQGANFFGDNQTGRSDSTLRSVEALTETLEAGLPPDVQLVISATEVDKRRAFYKRIAKLGKVEIHDKVDVSKSGWESDVIPLVDARSRAMGLVFAPGAMERFVMTVGAETRVIESELEKLSLFVGDRPATEEDVSRIAAKSHQGVVFEIGNALARKNLPKTLELIERQLRQGENPVGILLAAIVPQVRNLLHARDLIERHGLRAGRSYPAFAKQVDGLPASETAHLPRKKDGGVSAYPIFLAAQVSDRFSASELRSALEACLEANERLVTTQLEPRLVLEELATKILAR